MIDHEALKAFVTRERDLEWECFLDSKESGVNGNSGACVAVGAVDAYNKVLAYIGEPSEDEGTES